jgi:hypothetical protein
MESSLIADEGMDGAERTRDGMGAREGAHADAAPDAGADAMAPADWEQAHAELVRLARGRAGLDSEEAHWLLIALRSGAHRRLGFASFLESASHRSEGGGRRSRSG